MIRIRNIKTRNISMHQVEIQCKWGLELTIREREKGTAFTCTETL